jgi:transposase-like protein
MVGQETKANWKQSFRNLVTKGLDTSRLQLVASDGRPGLHTAIRCVFPQTIKHQRCIFHKLKNLGDNLTYKNLILRRFSQGSEVSKACSQSTARISSALASTAGCCRGDGCVRTSQAAR